MGGTIQDVSRRTVSLAPLGTDTFCWPSCFTGENQHDVDSGFLMPKTLRHTTGCLLVRWWCSLSRARPTAGNPHAATIAMDQEAW
jgi:hypothetical protein